MSATQTKAEVNIRNIPMQELRPQIEQSLATKGLRTELEYVTDNDLGLKLQKAGYESHLKLFRDKHRPLQVKIEIDYNYYRQQNQAFKENRKRNKRRGSQSNSMFRIYWLLLIFGGIIISILYAFSSVFAVLFEFLTPGWSTTQRGSLVLVIFAFIIILGIYIMPRLNQQRARNSAKQDQDIMNFLVSSLNDLELSMTDIESMKCWSCFKDIDVRVEFCSYCGKPQN